MHVGLRVAEVAKRGRLECCYHSVEKSVITFSRTAQPRILQGKSLRGLFTIYALLARPTAFDAYIGCSAGWFAENNEYFSAMSARAFATVGAYSHRRVFMANSLRDQNDPDQTIHRQMIEFSRILKAKLGEAISYRYETYLD
jgi:predicted alpha/beta superfamily hydrolase